MELSGEFITLTGVTGLVLAALEAYSRNVRKSNDTIAERNQEIHTLNMKIVEIEGVKTQLENWRSKAQKHITNQSMVIGNLRKDKKTLTEERDEARKIAQNLTLLLEKCKQSLIKEE